MAKKQRRRVYTVQRRSRDQLSVRKLNVEGRYIEEDNFLESLQSLLFHCDATQTRMAEQADLSTSTIANLVYRKTREPRATTMLEIMRARGVRLQAHHE